MSIFTYSITKLKSDLSGILHGTTINQVTNIYGLINRAASTFLLDCDPQETIRTFPIVNGVYSAVFEYGAPIDVKGNRVLSFFPQVQKFQPRNQFSQLYQQDFNFAQFWNAGSSFNVLFNSGIKTMQINWVNAPIGTLVNEADNISDNGTWATGGDATALTVDNQNFVAGNGSLKFNLVVTGSAGFLENSTVQAVDLSDVVNQSTLFLYTFLPTASDFSSVELRWGSSETDYYVQSATMTQQQTVFQNGWNLLAFAWDGATVVGAPDPSNITYLRVTWNYNGTAQTAVRLDNIVSRMSSILNCSYYSKYLFSNAITGAWQENVLTDSDRINLDTESYNVFLWLVALFTVQQQSGSESAFDAKYFSDMYMKGLKRYTTMYKSQVLKPKVVYYKQPMTNLRNFFRGNTR